MQPVCCNAAKKVIILGPPINIPDTCLQRQVMHIHLPLEKCQCANIPPLFLGSCWQYSSPHCQFLQFVMLCGATSVCPWPSPLCVVVFRAYEVQKLSEACKTVDPSYRSGFPSRRCYGYSPLRRNTDTRGPCVLPKCQRLSVF